MERVVVAMRNPLTRNVLLLYFVIACVPPWIGWSLLVFGVVPQNSPLSGPMFLTGESASLAGLIATFLAQGPKGVTGLLRQAVRVNQPVQRWLFALIVPQILYVAAGMLYLVLHASR
jgi:hypothetical protein